MEVEQILSLRRQHRAITAQVEAPVDAHPLYEGLISMPGIRVRACARILTKVTGKHFAPPSRTWRLTQESSRDPGEHRAGAATKNSNEFCPLGHPCPAPPGLEGLLPETCRGKRHNQSLNALARRRSDALFAMLGDGTLFEDQCPRIFLQPLDENRRGTPFAAFLPSDGALAGYRRNSQ